MNICVRNGGGRERYVSICMCYVPFFVGQRYDTNLYEAYYAMNTHIVLHVKVHVLRAHLRCLVDGEGQLFDAVLLEGQRGDAERGDQRENSGCGYVELHFATMIRYRFAVDDESVDVQFMFAYLSDVWLDEK